MNNQDLQKYIVFCKERSNNPPSCCIDYLWIIESKTVPTTNLLKKNNLIKESYRTCGQISSPGCESCIGTHIETFEVIPYSEEKISELESILESRKEFPLIFHKDMVYTLNTE